MPVHGQVADGRLDAEAILALDQNHNGIPDILETRLGVAKFQLDNRVDGGLNVGPDGFRDSALSPNVVPLCATCVDAPPSGDGRVRSPFNTGRLTVIYLPDSDGIVNPAIPASDDSVLYVGFDIANGDARRVPMGAVGIPDVDFHDVDYILGPGETTCEYGFPDDFNNATNMPPSDGLTDYFMVPFDVDGDGNPLVIGRFANQPGPPCLIALEPSRDLQQESYVLEVHTCGSPSLLLLVSLSMWVEVTGDFVTVNVQAPGSNPALAQVSTFPSAGTTSAQIRQRGLDAFAGDPAAVGTLDVEFVIENVDSVLQQKYAAFPYSLNRYRLFGGRVLTQSGSVGDLSQEDEIETPFNLGAPQIEVTKEIRCGGANPGDWSTFVDVAPGAQVDFRITVENTGNQNLAVTLADTLQAITAGSSIAPVPGSLQVTLHRRANAPGQVVTFANAGLFNPPLNPNFLDDPGLPGEQGFLASLNGMPVCLGILQGVDVCTNPSAPVPGDKVVVIFSAIANAGSSFCNVTPVNLDARNSVTATGDPDFAGACPLAPNGNEVSDQAAIVDTPREVAQGFDDNVVRVNLLCRDVDFIKEVRQLPNGPFFTGATGLILTPPFPITIEYRYTITNDGEIDEPITLTDLFLCQDVTATPDVDFVAGQCALCDAPTPGVIEDVVLAGQTNTYTCQVLFASQAGLNAFLVLDNNRPECMSAPGPECYRNCATVLAGPPMPAPATGGHMLSDGVGDTYSGVTGTTDGFVGSPGGAPIGPPSICGHVQTPHASFATICGCIPPVCDNGGPYTADCVNGVVTVQLDGSGSIDPGGLPLTYVWTTTCPQATFTPSNTVESPILTFPRPSTCPFVCEVTLCVSNGICPPECCTTTVTFDDNTPPMLQCPPDVSVQCDSEVPPRNRNAVIATDNCGPVIVTHVGDQSTGTCPRTIVRTYRGTDTCGNTAECQQIITVDDTIPPVITCPPDVTVECPNPTDPGATGSATATDNCDLSVDITHTDTQIPGNCPQKFSIRRDWLATDDCGNTALCTQIITVRDTTPPTITCPPPANVECDSQVPPAATNLTQFVAQGGAAADTCGPVTVLHVGDASQGSCPRTITRTYRASDACGNSAQCTQLITVDDNTPPTITCPPPVNVQCPTQVPPAAINLGSFQAQGGTASDNCGDVSVAHVSDTPSGGTCPQTITRLYRATDLCGNTADCTQLITVNDEIPPTINCPPPVSVQCDNQVPAPATNLAQFVNQGGSSSDNCGAVTISHVGDSSAGTCPRTITRTYRATDTCGRTAQCTQTITVDDTIPPVITCPPDVTVECPNPTDPGATGMATATDNCDTNVDITHGDVQIPGNCPQKFTIRRDWLATDDCGNTALCSQFITVRDTTPPTITCPPPVSVECVNGVPPAATNLTQFIALGGSAGDTCGPVTVEHIGDAPNGQTCPMVITRTYRATDACGRTAQCTQLITVDDNTPPTITCPPPVNVQCDSGLPAPATNLAQLVAQGGSAADNCGTVNISHIGDVPNGATCPKTITRTYRATDLCGNTAQCTQLLTVNDTTPPTITCPPPVNVECDNQVPAAATNLVQFQAQGGVATDNCGEVTVSHIGDATQGTCPRTITRTYRATDLCGNTAQCTQTITVNDLTPPTINCPPPVAVQCDNQVPAAATNLTQFVTQGGSAGDNCGAVTISHVGDSSQGTCPRTITRTYRATDTCGRTAQCTQTITVDDTIPPVITCPPDVIVECGQPTDPGATGTATATDNCDTNVAISHTDTQIGGNCPQKYTIRRDWLATDDCGNTALCTQLITVRDTTPPTITCPPPVNVECDSQVPPPAINLGQFVGIGGSAGDNCGPVTVEHIGDAPNGQTCPMIITRTYRATDACGRTAQCTQLITVDDNTPPTITCPPPVSVECDNQVPAPATNLTQFTAQGGSAGDNCGTVSISHISDVPNGQTCPKIITRTYRATDLCGNTAQCTQLITVDDNTPPSITCPPPVTVECPTQVPPAATSLPQFQSQGGSASDNCAVVSVSHVGDVPSGQICPLIITRTYRATDQCGNTAQCVQLITVNDTTPPTIMCPPDVIACIGETDPSHTGTATGTDNCGPPTITYTDEGGCPPGGAVYEWHWNLNEPAVLYDNSAGTFESIFARFDSATNELTWIMTFSNQITDGFYLVLNNGPDIANVVGAYAAVYYDRSGGGRLLVYAYNGGGFFNNWIDGDISVPGNQPPDLIESSLLNPAFILEFIDQDVNGKRILGFKIDATNINNHVPLYPHGTPWYGIGFGEQMGVWVRTFDGLSTAYNNGRISLWNWGAFGWLDGFDFDSDGCMNQITRTWCATDTCGNSTCCVQKITVEPCGLCVCPNDITPPMITCPPDTTACVGQTGPPFTGTATATDNCAPPTVTYVDVPDCPPNGQAIYEWNWHYTVPDGIAWSNTAGTFESAYAKWDTTNNQLTWKFVFSNQVTDGFWLVLNNGPDAGGIHGRFAAIYFDRNGSGTPRIIVYVYNGGDFSNTWTDGNANQGGTQPPDFIQSSIVDPGFVLETFNINDGGKRTLGFRINATTILNHVPLYPNGPWFGTGFGQQLGVWARSFDNLTTAYDAAGKITTWNAGLNGYFDGSDIDSDGCPSQILRVWRATDQCGNTAECDQMITVQECP